MNKLERSIIESDQDLSPTQITGEKPELSAAGVTKNIVKGADGKFHWSYDFSLYRNPTILMLLWKIFFYAAIMGGKYSVIFEMDETGIKHIQLARQYERAQLLSYLSMLAGISSGQVSAAAPGFNAAMKQSTYSKFQQVRAIVLPAK
ncbi:MAG: hypothetical protein GX768_09915 [Chloroflexi bacterium]|nr:hypothetical protein [Chloroflexota bacterium]